MNLDELKAKAAAAWQRTFNSGNVSKLAVDATLQLANGETLADVGKRAVKNGTELVGAHEAVVAKTGQNVRTAAAALRSSKKTHAASRSNLRDARVALSHAKNVLGASGVADVPDEPDNQD